ncbi:MAG: 50S ribosomal protein L17 [Caloramator sp.]|nr:50S ribosomal protein L17 [Caloramator sp.]
MAGYRKLGRPTDQRKAMLRNLVTSFFKSEDGRIVTTEMRAKEVRSIAEKMITLAKRGDLHARRQALSYITEEEVVNKLFNETAKRYTERNGGYTRIVKIGPRRGDAAETVILELV